jgi:hypothetical protein
VLINELGRIVHLIMNDHEQIPLRVVFGDVLVRVFIVGHLDVLSISWTLGVIWCFVLFRFVLGIGDAGEVNATEEKDSRKTIFVGAGGGENRRLGAWPQNQKIKYGTVRYIHYLPKLALGKTRSNCLQYPTRARSQARAQQQMGRRQLAILNDFVGPCSRPVGLEGQTTFQIQGPLSESV